MDLGDQDADAFDDLDVDEPAAALDDADCAVDDDGTGLNENEDDDDESHNRAALQDAIREAEEAADIDAADDIDRERLGRHGLIISNGLTGELEAAITWIEEATGIRESEWGVVERDRLPEGQPLTNMRQWLEESLLAGDKGAVPFLGHASLSSGANGSPAHPTCGRNSPSPPRSTLAH